MSTAHVRHKVVTIDRATVESGIERGLIYEEVRTQAREGWRVESVIKDHRFDPEGHAVDCVQITFERSGNPVR